MKRTAWSLGMVCAVLASGCMFVHRPLVNPEVNIPASASQDFVKRSVYEALTHYGWVIDEEKPGATIAHQQQNELFARVQVEYTQSHATIRYLESKNIYHSKSPSGEEVVHSRYLVWVRNVAERLNSKLNPSAAAAVESGASRRKEP